MQNLEALPQRGPHGVFTEAGVRRRESSSLRRQHGVVRGVEDAVGAGGAEFHRGAAELMELHGRAPADEELAVGADRRMAGRDQGHPRWVPAGERGGDVTVVSPRIAVLREEGLP